MMAGSVKSVEKWESTSKACVVTYHCFSTMKWLLKSGEKIPFDEAGNLKMTDLPTYPQVGGGSALGPWSMGLSKILISQLSVFRENGWGYVTVDLDTSLNLSQFIEDLATVLKSPESTLLSVADKLESKLDFSKVTLEV